MFKRYLAPDSTGFFKKQQHFITLIGLLMCIMGSQNVYPQKQIALDTYAIFQQSCLICHGPDGAYKESLLMEHNALIEKGSVVPGNPDASELYDRLLITDTAKRMPLGQPQLPAQSINTIRNWILAGAPDWAVTSTTDGDFISPAEILNTIENHLMSLSSFDRAFARYFTMTHLYNAGASVQILQEYRKALYKLVNSLSWKVTVTNPHPIDPQGTIFYIDLRHYEWDVNDAWGQMEAAYPYHISFEAPTQTALRDQLGRLQGEMKSSIPSVHIDWFLANASLPPLYHELLSLPLTAGELETRLEVNVVRNLNNAPGIDVWRAGFNNSGVSNNNRMVERHASRYGAYWKSYDFAGSIGTQNIFTHPLSFTHDGGEGIFNLPNGLQAYYVTNASGFRLDAAPIGIVSNPAASDPTVRNGLSCFGCHTEGMETFEDEVRAVIESNTAPAYDKAQALRLYVEQSEMDALLQEDTDRYKEALEATGGAFDGIEPISRFHEVFQGTVDASYAAAVVGLETEAFLEKIRENIGLQNIGLLVLDSDGSMKRDAWTSSFRDILFALDFPELVDKPPVRPEPDRLPGASVHIPDSNLRTAIAEALGKSPNAPITAEEMGRLKRLVAKSRGIRDLIGLQFAMNLTSLHIPDNSISDILPLEELVSLTYLNLWENSISDISPVAGLTNLTELYLQENSITDISPVTGLTNLKSLWIPHNNISDISPIAGLTNLTRLALAGNSISDISPVAGLTNLTWLELWNNNISDISPVTGLINLKFLWLTHNNISDISPVAELTNLTSLNLTGNSITDISAVAELTNLTDLSLARNSISDISAVAELTNLTDLNLWNNNISDISPLVVNTELGEAYEVDVGANPLSYQSIRTHIPALQSRGVAVKFDNLKPPMLEKLLSIPAGTSLIHVPLRVIAVDGVAKTIRLIADLYDVLGGASTVNFLITYDSLTQEWRSYFGPSDTNTYADKILADDTGIIAGLKVPVSLRLSGNPLGTNGRSTITLKQGINLVGLPLRDSRITRVSDLFALNGIGGNVSVIILTDSGEFKAVGRVDDPGDIKITGGQSFILNAQQATRVIISGDGWYDTTAIKAAPSVENADLYSRITTSIQVTDTTPILALRGSITDEGRGLRQTDFHVIVKNLSTGKEVATTTADDSQAYRLTLVDIETGQAATLEDILEISAQSPHPLVGVEPLQYTVTAEDVRQGLIQLPALVAYKIPAETALLHNYPNPFNPETWIPYQLGHAADVTLAIYDTQGALVRQLDLGYQQAGYYTNKTRAAYWDGRNYLGELVGSGVYFYHLRADDYSTLQKMVILK